MMSRALFLLRFDLLTRVLEEQSGFVSLALRMVAERVWLRFRHATASVFGARQVRFRCESEGAWRY